MLDRLAVDPQIAGSFDWHGFGDSGVRRRRLAEDGFLGCDPPQPGDRLRQDDSCIGDVSWLAVPTGPTSTCWNIGIVIVPEFRGKGYGTAAQRLVTGYLFATTTANRAEAGTDVENLAEQRALERPGSPARASGADRSPETARGGTRRYTAVSAMIPHRRPATDRHTLTPRTGSSAAGLAQGLAISWSRTEDRSARTCPTRGRGALGRRVDESLADRVHARSLDGGEPDVLETLIETEGEVTSLLHGPLARRAGSDPAEVHLAGAIFDKH